MALQEFSEPVLSPQYWQVQPNEMIDLGNHQIEYPIQGVLHTFEANVRLRFLPRNRLEIYVPPSQSTFAGLLSPVDQIKWKSSGVSTRVITTQNGSGGTIFVPRREPIEPWKPVAAIDHATFHLFSFPNFYTANDFVLTRSDQDGTRSTRCGHLVLLGDNWRFTIAAVESTDKNEQLLKAQGGTITTHAGKIEREDGSEFSSDDLIEAHTLLTQFLSFALGRWAGVGLLTAFDATGRRLWEMWGLPSTASDAWEGGNSWFDSMHGDALVSAFAGYCDLRKKLPWAKSLWHVVYWYIRASGGSSGMGPDTGLVIAQAAIELLAWTFCTQDRKMVSEYAFGRRGLNAADKIRLLATTLEIPLNIPPSLKALNGRPGKKWADGADAITSIRNSLVHPGNEITISDDSYYEAWKFSMWLIELTLLRLFNVDGHYANRLRESRWKGQLDPLPWVTAHT